MRRLVICLDGTWNVVDDTTNIWRIYSSVSDIDPDSHVQQVKYYDEGVGTKWYDKITGGALGAGTYKNVKEAYTWLATEYRPGDQIVLFGFSRGALTALSLANLIDRCGIIGPRSHNTFEEAYRLYALPGFSRQSHASRRFRRQSADYGRVGTLKFLGLFDTVASLFLKRLTGERSHALSLPSSAEHVFHAIALDENRRLFQSVEFPSAPMRGQLHERWFSGAHANVGGGYAFDPLAALPLAWMMENATTHAQVAFRGHPSHRLSAALAVRHRNSFEEFGLGIPAVLSWPFPGLLWKARSLGRPAQGSAEEWIDKSAIARYRALAAYRSTCSSIRNFFGPNFIPTGGDIDVKHAQSERTS